MSKNPETWSKEQFTTFLLIYISNEDLDFSESEKKSILKNIDRESFQKIKDFYDGLGEYEKLEFILKFKSKYFATPENKEEMLQLISSHSAVDGEVSKLERTLIEFLKRLL